MHHPIWYDYHRIYQHEESTVVGNLKVARAVYSPQLDNQRDVFVYLPPSYERDTDRRYPVVYMQDGQNLFDAALSFAGEWGVDDTMEALSREEHLEAIIVGIPNMGERRMAEYSPFRSSQDAGMGNQYLSFLVNSLKPIIDQNFRTLPGKRYTGIMGSSMGGLISLYAFFRYANVFGFTGVMSPSLWVAGGSIFGYLKTVPFHPGKIYLDVGTRELGDSPEEPYHQRKMSRQYYASVRRLKRILVRKGYRPIRDLLHIEEKWAHHTESAWARRLPDAMRFFLHYTYQGMKKRGRHRTK